MTGAVDLGAPGTKPTLSTAIQAIPEEWPPADPTALLTGNAQNLPAAADVGAKGRPAGDGPLVLIVDDEVQIRRFLRLCLGAHGYRVHETDSGEDAVLKTAQLRPDCVILDLGLPDVDGLEVLRRLREWTPTPVIVLSVRSSDRDKIAALDSGADDYLTKPFSVAELMARLRVALRHAQPPAVDAVFNAGQVQVDLARRAVSRGGQPVKLTPTEYALLRLFVQHAGRVLTHRHILREVWGPDYEEETHYLRVYVAQLRQKLEEQPAVPRLILTEPGVGYRLAEGN